MQNQHIPVLIFAQSGRFLAQSATQAGYPVWVADCFGDTDTLSVAERWLSLAPFSALTHDSIFSTLSELTQGQNCLLLCGSGIEQCYHLLHPLPDNIKLVGNSTASIDLIKTPSKFFTLLEKLGLAYPETQFIPPSNNQHWLAKENKGLGGSHIQHLQHANNPTTQYYYQRIVSGISGSCLFISDGKNAYILSINKQNLSPTKQAPFRLGSIESPLLISPMHQHDLEQAINKLTTSVPLVGLNSLDFMISEQNELLILEINPRPSASAELIADKAGLLQLHIDACLGNLQTKPDFPQHTNTSLFYHYAVTDLIIPDNMEWPIECHDLPAAGISIKQGEPICSSQVISDGNTAVSNLHLDIEHSFLKQIDSTPLEK